MHFQETRTSLNHPASCILGYVGAILHVSGLNAILPWGVNSIFAFQGVVIGFAIFLYGFGRRQQTVIDGRGIEVKSTFRRTIIPLETIQDWVVGGPPAAFEEGKSMWMFGLGHRSFPKKGLTIYWMGERKTIRVSHVGGTLVIGTRFSEEIGCALRNAKNRLLADVGLPPDSPQPVSL